MLRMQSSLRRSLAVDRWIGMDQLVDSRNRRLAERALMESMDLLKQGKPTEEIAGQFNMQVAKALSQGKGQVQAGKAAKEAYSEFLSIDAGDSSAIPTGFTKLNDYLGGGFTPGRLYCIGARPGVGKSALAIHFSHEIAKRGYRVAYASLEMSASECAGRLLSRESGVARPRQSGMLLPAHRKRLEDATKRMQDGLLLSKMITRLRLIHSAPFSPRSERREMLVLR